MIRQGVRLAAFLTSLVALCACGGAAPPFQAHADWDHTADFKTQRTFGIGRSPFVPATLTPQQQELLGIVEATTRRELVKKGLTEAPPQSADLLAMPYFLGRQRLKVDVDLSNCSNSLDYDIEDGRVIYTAVPQEVRCAESAVSEFREGSLIIDVYDTRKKELVWHGWASAERPDPASGKAAKLVEDATAAVWAKFPP